MQTPSHAAARDGEAALPLVTAGMAIYNSAATLARALDSLLAQDYPNLEIVICEDCSTDGSLAVCEEYAARHPNIRLYRNPENYGFTRNYRQVVERGRGEFFFWADGDDIHLPGYVSTLVKALEGRPGAAVAQGALERRYDDGEPVDVKRFPPAHDPTRKGPLGRTLYFVTTRSELRSLKHNYFQMGLFRREILLRALDGYPWKLGERTLLAAMSLDHGFVYVDKVLTVVHMHRTTALERHPGIQALQEGSRMSIFEHRLQVWRHLRSCPEISFVSRYVRLPLLAARLVVTESRIRREIRKAVFSALAERAAGIRRALAGKTK